MGSINNDIIEYKDLSKVQRLAIFLIAIGPEGASSVLSYFERDEMEMICREISNMKIVDEGLKYEAMEEFMGLMSRAFGSILGGMSYAQKTLEMAKGGEGADILDRIVPGGGMVDLIDELCELKPKQLFNLLKVEQAQTLAFVISHLSVEKAAELIKMLPEEKRDEVLEDVAGMSDVPLEMLAKMAKVLKPYMGKEENVKVESSDGVTMVANILNLSEKGIGKSLMDHLDNKNPELGVSISKKMFTFNDLLKLSVEDLQRVTREVETNDLVTALKGVSKVLEDAIMQSVSKRAAESLRDEIEMLGPVKVKLVEQAQERIIQVVRRLEEEGAIDLEQGEGNVIE